MPNANPIRIEIRSSDDRVVHIAMCSKPTLTIGSSPDSDLVLTGQLVKPTHLQLRFIPDRAHIFHPASERFQRENPDQQWESSNEYLIYHDVDEETTSTRTRAFRFNSQRNHAEGIDRTTASWPERRYRFYEIGEYRIALLASTDRAVQNHRGISERIFGPSVDLNRAKFAGLPVSGLTRAWWLLILIFGGGVLLGSCGGIGRRYLRSILPQPLELRQLVSRPDDTMLPPTAASTPTVTDILPTLSATPTAASLSATPTLMPIRAQANGQDGETNPNQASASRAALVDGPSPPPTIGPPLIVVTATATEEPTPSPTPTIPPVGVIDLSPALQALKVSIEPAVVPFGQEYWRLTEARWLNEEESLGRNYIFIEVLDATGMRVMEQRVRVAWKDDSVSLITNKPLPDPYAVDFLMNASGNVYSVRVEGLPSDTIHGLGMGTVADPLAYTQTAFWLKFQRTVREPNQVIE